MENNNLAFVAQEWLEPIANCPAECRNRVILAIVEYQLTGVDPVLDDGVAAIAFAYIKPNVDRMAQFRRQQAERRKSSSSSSKSTKTEPELTENNRTETDGDQYSKSKSESKSKSKSESKNNQESDARKAAPAPSVLEIENFCKAKGIANVDPQKFYDYYTPRGWRTAQGNPVRDWQAQLLTWSARENEATPSATTAVAPAQAAVTPEETAVREAAELRERLKRKQEMDYYAATVPNANTKWEVISYPEFCALGLHERTPDEIAEVIDKVRRGLISRNPIFVK